MKKVQVVQFESEDGARYESAEECFRHESEGLICKALDPPDENNLMMRSIEVIQAVQMVFTHRHDLAPVINEILVNERVLAGIADGKAAKE